MGAGEKGGRGKEAPLSGPRAWGALRIRAQGLRAQGVRALASPPRAAPPGLTVLVGVAVVELCRRERAGAKARKGRAATVGQ